MKNSSTLLVNDGKPDPVHLVIEIKGFRNEDAKDKKTAMDTYWIPGVINDGGYGRWAFAEFRDVYEIEADFEKKLAGRFDEIVIKVMGGAVMTSPVCVVK